VTSAGIQALGENLAPTLKELDISGANLFTDESLRIMSTCLTKLQILKVGGCKLLTDEGVLSLAQNCADLRGINVYGCKNLTDKSLEALGKYSTKLCFINITGCKEITDFGIQCLSSLRLQVLDLALCSKITDRSLKVLSKSSQYSMQNLALDYLSNLTDDGFSCLTNFKLLTELRISGCLILDSSLKLISSLINLEVLYLNDTAITNRGIQILVGEQNEWKCSHLMYLNLQHCRSISSEGLMTLLKNLENLKELDIKHNSHLLDTIQKIQNEYPKVNILPNLSN